MNLQLFEISIKGIFNYNILDYTKITYYLLVIEIELKL